MTEKEVKDRAEQIIEALSALTLGREPNLLSGSLKRFLIIRILLVSEMRILIIFRLLTEKLMPQRILRIYSISE